MRPIELTHAETVPARPDAICDEIIDVDRWHEFTGYGIVPGIASARFESRTASVTGSRVRVTNRDGSQHTEEIVRWSPGERVTIRMASFSRPLSLLADHFIEDWQLTVRRDGSTEVKRTFSLYPKNVAGRAVLRIVAVFLRRAVMRHMRLMRLNAERARRPV